MKRTLVLITLLILALPSLADAQAKKKKGPCKPSLAQCPVTGCGTGIDKNLNRRKNIKTAPTGAAEDMTIAQIKDLEDPVKNRVTADLLERQTPTIILS